MCRLSPRIDVLQRLRQVKFLQRLVKHHLETRAGELKQVSLRQFGRIGQKLIIPPAPVAPENQDYTGRTRWVYQELRDRKVALFIDKLPEGIWEIRYELRAEVPGKFHALPVLGQAMYVPEIRCNGAETRVTVEEAKP